MHFNIIQISEQRVPKGDRIDYYDVGEDPMFLAETDYGGDERTGEDRRDALECIQNQIKEFANVDVKTATITFKEKKIVKRAWVRHINKAVKTFKESLSDGVAATAEYKLRTNIAELASGDLWYYRYCTKFADIVADYLAGYLPKTLHIGAILDAHC